VMYENAEGLGFRMYSVWYWHMYNRLGMNPMISLWMSGRKFCPH
jgi:hypothetical protein